MNITYPLFLKVDNYTYYGFGSPTSYERVSTSDQLPSIQGQSVATKHYVIDDYEQAPGQYLQITEKEYLAQRYVAKVKAKRYLTHPE